MLNGSAPAAASGRLWVVSGLPPARHSTGGAGVDPAAAASGCILALALVRHWSNLAFSLLFGWQGELPILAAKNGEKIGSPFFARGGLAIPHAEKCFRQPQFPILAAPLPILAAAARMGRGENGL